MTTVDWTFANSKYQVSSANHLLCMAARGVGFTTTGTPPSSQGAYLTASYLQTADIDCSGYTMVPIGDSTNAYNCTYNGQNFKILNWQNNQSNTTSFQGLFGNASGGTYYNIIMGGVIKVK